jgi:hypothetical protein
MSNNCVAGIPVMIEPTNVFFIETAYWCLDSSITHVDVGLC